MMKKRKMMVVALVVTMLFTLTGCDFAGLKSKLSELKGSLVGNEYEITFYDNYGAKFLTMNGDKIDIDGNCVEENGYSSDGSITTNYSLSSVITITIDGSEVESCGDTVIFAGAGLTPVVDFSISDTINSSSKGITDLTSVGKELNKYKNYFGKKRVVLIQSQLGVPICAFQGDNVYWEVPDDLPKMTKLMVDGKPLYSHRCNFQIIDAELIKD